MVYTCYEMIRDCRAGRPEGWSYLVTNYVPVIRRWLEHYYPEGADPGRILVRLKDPQSGLFASLEPAPEREFLCELRQSVLETADDRLPVEIELDLETLTAALAPLTLVEKQVVAFEIMRYTDEDTARMLRMEAATVHRIRERAAELIRGKVDAWRQTLIGENGPLLRRAIRAARTEACYPSKMFFDVLDGRTNWYMRGDLERHIVSCWHCIDRFCRCAEVVDVLRETRPLTEADAARYRELLGVAAPPKASLIRKIFG